MCDIYACVLTIIVVGLIENRCLIPSVSTCIPDICVSSIFKTCKYQLVLLGCLVNKVMEIKKK